MRARIYMLAMVSVAAVPLLAEAQVPNPLEGVMNLARGSEFYVGAAGGWNNQPNSDVEGSGINKEVEFDDGWAALGTIGYRAPSGFRGELELGYRTNEVDSISGTPATTGGNSGDVHAWTIMANVLYDFVNKTPFTPYLGVGIGAAAIDYDDVRTIGTGGAAVINDSTWAPAAQGIVGVNYQVHNNVGLFANYQYLQAFANPRVKTSSGVKTDIDYENHTVLAGLRVSFGAPKPAPVEPAPAPEPVPEPTPAPQEPAEAAPVAPLSYMVFFDFDKSAITPEARSVLETAVQNAKENNVVRIDVTGHADRAGSDEYNMRLSKRRADAVKKELVKLGISAAEIATEAKGESDPLVPTDDGVREPQNRRVEIIYTQGNRQQ